MRTLSTNLQNAIAAGSTRLAHIYTFTRKDGVIKRFTDFSRDLVVSGQTFKSNHSVIISNITSSINSGVQSADAGVIFNSTEIDEVDVVRGKYDGADAELSIVAWDHPEYGRIILLTGKLGSIEVTNKRYGNMEIRGLLSRADIRIGEYYSAECRADLGDERCKVLIASPPFTKSGVVTSVPTVAKIRCTISGSPVSGFMSFGVMSWITGDNAGLSIEVLSQANLGGGIDELTLALALPYPVVIGDTFTIVAGCDKRRETCIGKFDNIENMRAEPFVPGDDIVLDFPITDA